MLTAPPASLCKPWASAILALCLHPPTPLPAASWNTLRMAGKHREFNVSKLSPLPLPYCPATAPAHFTAAPSFRCWRQQRWLLLLACSSEPEALFAGVMPLEPPARFPCWILASFLTGSHPVPYLDSLFGIEEVRCVPTSLRANVCVLKTFPRGGSLCAVQGALA